MKGQENPEGFEVNRHISFWCMQIIFIYYVNMYLIHRDIINNLL